MLDNHNFMLTHDSSQVCAVAHKTLLKIAHEVIMKKNCKKITISLMRRCIIRNERAMHGALI